MKEKPVSLRGVPFEDALRALLRTKPLPKRERPAKKGRNKKKPGK